MNQDKNLLLRFIFIIFVCGSTGNILSILNPRHYTKERFDEFLGIGRLDDDNITEIKIGSQPLDHFSLNTSRKFSQRYMVNNGYYKDGGPIFLYLTGPEVYGDVPITSSHFYYTGREHNAMFYNLETRYYGKTRPTENITVPELAFITTEQILSDTARFIQTMKADPENPGLANAKVIVGGTEIAGSYAVWLAQKYPTLVDGVWASSAPLLFKHEFPEFRELQGIQIRKWGSDACYNRIEEAFTMMQEMADNGNVDRLNEAFSTCPKLTPNNKILIWTFFHRLASAMDLYISFNYGPISVESACSIITNGNYKDAIAAYAAFTKQFSFDCFDIDYDRFIEDNLYTIWSSNGQANNRQWLYQLCFEFNWWPTTSSTNQPFGQTVPVDYFYSICKDVFGRDFKLKNMREIAKRKNKIYGGMESKVKNVFYSHGEMDPFHTLGVQGLNTDQSSAAVIDGYSAGRDFDTMMEYFDTVDMLIVKERIRDMIGKWLED